MDSNSRMNNTVQSPVISPKWKSGTYFFKPSHSAAKKPSSICLKKSSLKSNELDKYKQKISNRFKKSPILKAYSNIDEFYRSIKPVKSALKNSLLDCPPNEKPAELLSFYSNKSSQESEALSHIMDFEQLNRLNQALTEEKFGQEDELYQSALKSLHYKLSAVIQGKTIENLKKDGAENEENSFEY